MRLPSVDDLIDYLDIYAHSPDDHVFVAGPPGSGKTSLAVHRAMFLTRLGKRVVVVTKNRMLAALARELGGGTFEATRMHTLVSKDYNWHFGGLPPQLVPFVYDWDSLGATYGAKGIAPALDHLVIDEGQNLPPGFFGWARRHGARTLTVFADEDQGIDEHRSTLQDISLGADLGNPIRLTYNYRNTPEIAAVAEHFHQSAILPPALVQKGAGGEAPHLVRLPSLAAFVQRVVTRYRNRHEAIGIVVRTKKEALDLHKAIRDALPAADHRVDVYTSDNEKETELSIRLLDPGVTVLTGESVIGLEFEVVYLLDLSRSLPCATPADSRRMYMLCSRARDALNLIDLPRYLGPDQIAALPSPPILVR